MTLLVFILFFSAFSSNFLLEIIVPLPITEEEVDGGEDVVVSLLDSFNVNPFGVVEDGGVVCDVDLFSSSEELTTFT